MPREPGRQLRQLVTGGTREAETVVLGHEPRRVADGGHLDCRFRPVDEGREHTRVGACGSGSVALPHRVGGGQLEARFVARPLAGADDLEPAHPRPLDELADERRLVAIGERVHEARLARAPGKRRADEHVGLHGDHHHVLAVLERSERMACACPWRAGRLDDHVASSRAISSAASVPIGAPFGSPPSALEIEIGHPRELEPFDMASLGREHRRELAGADHADAEWLRAAGELRDEIVHRGSLSTAVTVIYRCFTVEAEEDD